MSKKLHEKVVVITGASSGTCRAAALLFARRGANVVRAARTAESLEEVAIECRRSGVQALTVPTDVRDPAAVRALAQRAAERFGRIDVWVNGAALSIISLAEEAPDESYRQLIEANVLGTIYGCIAVMPYFRAQGSGVLINMSSIAGVVGVPYIAGYAASKAAVHNFSDSIREELRDVPGVHVCAVIPPTIDTPFYQHSANYTGRSIHPVPPIYRPERVARAIVSLAERPRRNKPIGLAGRAVVLGQRLAPTLAMRLGAAWVNLTYFEDRHAPPTNGNLFEPMPAWNRIRGGWREKMRHPRALKDAASAALALPGAMVRALRG